MGGEEESQSNTQGGATKRKESTPPDGYVCRLCSVPGHWIQVCPTKKTGDKKRKRKPSDHVPVPGKDPSPEDVAEAQKMQEIPPPKCFCGETSRLNKVKRSKTGGDNSRALGKYFFFCSKKRDDETQCRFARPADLELNKMKARAGNKAAQKKAEQEESAQKRKETKQIKKAKVEQSEKKKEVEAAVEEDNDDSSSSSGSSSSSDEDSEGEAKKVDSSDSDSSSSDDDEE
mmetsp:Transcript_24435/g.48782  ORF Transcript_24435/g.48782 Transcript_24435/m.48782 type:complete len:230 (-) Transcript_24435:57-746(-)|eukprot:CAMPEP_0113389426 /NCGR_PEP_ID=MMETSP0013_2-20120614/9619_1 /TAXON_ID=2843 ORGANISM="Skeletonema costatum, Strain 1716" /NCGR_SAMPLE_ID=MMETSP0013_2 /ASSEMBLY_ACC=CAM_ASM_000158 /LENGTH=229 /DNA_ID=CAMNT_0000272499 /DNA_START=97 /DNA_END=786 /DNA_ORIENTATION=+ /assembly_acc=CAM_ASM_000158